MSHDTLLSISQSIRANAKVECELPPLVLMSDESVIAEPERLFETFGENMAFVFREYKHPNRADRAAELREKAKAHDIPFIVAGDTELAISLQADGLHIPSWQHKDEVEYMGLLTTAVHDADQYTWAVENVVSAAFVSPIFRSQSHEGTDPIDARLVNQMVDQKILPIYGLGGITHSNADELVDIGLSGIAGLRAFL